MKKIAILTILIVFAFSSYSTTKKKKSVFDKLDKAAITAFQDKMANEHIEISNTGKTLGEGMVIVYITDSGNYGKLEISEIDKEENPGITFKYVTYNYDDTILSQSENTKVKGTYTFDLDENGNEAERYEMDFWVEYDFDKKITYFANSEGSFIFHIIK